VAIDLAGTAEDAADALTHGDALHLRLLSSVHRRSDKRIAVGLAHRERRSCATVGCDIAAASAGTALVETGCITKLFTAAMMMQAVGAGRFSLDDAAGELLCRGSRDGLRLPQGISVRHLLEHTHGVDSSRLTQAPLREDGFIDAAMLCRELQDAGRLHEPGLLYSYGEGGPWLAAAILEACHGQPFRMLLETQLFAPMGVTISPTDTLRARVCPSSGGALAVPLEGLLEFLLAHCPSEERLASGGITPLPGWSSQECGIRLGWKHYGSGWFGHNSALAGPAWYECIRRRRSRSS
jgi:CubicO group peptidase (beta-lactamase class C family)